MMENKTVELRSEVLGQLLGLNSESGEDGQRCYALSIPDYQRIYSWEEKNVIRLLDDIVNYSDKTYHLGSIILHKRVEKVEGIEGEKIVYDIVDGQQRLVTLSLLLLQLGESDFGLLTESFESHKAQSYIAYNKWIIDNYINNLNEQTFSKERILTSISFSVLIVDDPNLDLAYTFFSNENGKGKPLSDYDLLKSHHLRYILIPEQAEHIAERWHNLIRASDNNDNSKELGHTIDLYLFRLRKWMRKRSWDDHAKRRVKNEFEAAPIISNIPPFGEQFNFYESIQGGTHFFAYVEHFVHRFNEFQQTAPYLFLNKYLNKERHWWYRDVIEALIFAYYLKFGRIYLNRAALSIIRVISDHRYKTSRAYLNSILHYTSSSEIILMIDQATSPTFFLAEIESAIKILSAKPDLKGTRERYRKAINEIEQHLKVVNVN